MYGFSDYFEAEREKERERDGVCERTLSLNTRFAGTKWMCMFYTVSVLIKFYTCFNSLINFTQVRVSAGQQATDPSSTCSVHGQTQERYVIDHRAKSKFHILQAYFIKPHDQVT